jgi:hypothetical protein
MNFFELKSAIEKQIGSTPCKLWTIGTTDDYLRRREQLEAQRSDCRCWEDWEADNATIAKSIEEHFLGKGMQNDTNGSKRDRSKYIYLF